MCLQVEKYDNSKDKGNITRPQYHKEVNKIKPYAMKDLKHSVYWYAITRYYLADQESYKVTALNPINPEAEHAAKFKSIFGRINALGLYTQQLVERFAASIFKYFNHYFTTILSVDNCI